VPFRQKGTDFWIHAAISIVCVSPLDSFFSTCPYSPTAALCFLCGPNKQAQSHHAVKPIFALRKLSFKELKEEIDSTWNAVLKADLLNTIGWMYDALEHEVSNGNYAYEQFLNRLFYLNNSHVPAAQRMKDEIFLKESLKYMMICLAFYPDRNFIFSNAQLLFKQGKQGDDAWNVFTIIYNAREKETYSQALRRIVSRSKDYVYTKLAANIPQLCHP
jgi:hypothetical protein